MPNEGGEWIIRGLSQSNPNRIKTADELIVYVKEEGFLPLFANDIPGFSVEEHTAAAYWWSGNEEKDPWEWREIIARSGEVAYGKFFNKKAGFISLDWLPYFANYRRDGYDYDSRWEDGKMSRREKKIMDLFEAEGTEMPSFDIKSKAGFGKDGEKNFDGTITGLMMQTYLTIKDFKRKKRKADGAEYGWPVAVYATPEELWGYKHVTSAYKEDPKKSKVRIWEHIKNLYPGTTDIQIKKSVGKK